MATVREPEFSGAASFAAQRATSRRRVGPAPRGWAAAQARRQALQRIGAGFGPKAPLPEVGDPPRAFIPHTDEPVGGEYRPLPGADPQRVGSRDRGGDHAARSYHGEGTTSYLIRGISLILRAVSLGTGIFSPEKKPELELSEVRSVSFCDLGHERNAQGESGPMELLIQRRRQQLLPQSQLQIGGVIDRQTVFLARSKTADHATASV